MGEGTKSGPKSLVSGAYENMSQNFHFSDDRSNPSSQKMSGGGMFIFDKKRLSQKNDHVLKLCQEHLNLIDLKQGALEA